MRTRFGVTAASVLALVSMTACGDDDAATTSTTATTQPTVTTQAALADDGQAVVDTLEAVVAAQNAFDGEAYVDLYSDQGLEQGESGTRAEILSGEGSFYNEESMIGEYEVLDPTVTGDTAEAVVHVRFGLGLYQVLFPLVRDEGAPHGWLVDGFQFEGGAPPAEGVAVVDIKAVNYGYDFDPAALVSGQLAINFENTGTEPHEMALFRVPEGASIPDVIAALGDVDGSSYEGVPTDYEVVDHLVFAMPGEQASFTAAEPIEAGSYAFVCFIPEGGLDPESGEPLNPEGTAHVKLGMVGQFTVD